MKMEKLGRVMPVKIKCIVGVYFNISFQFIAQKLAGMEQRHSTTRKIAKQTNNDSEKCSRN
jgi:hypothetical protein